jgi:cold shock CspA family protein
MRKIMDKMFKKFFNNDNAPTEPDTTPIKPEDNRIKGKIIKLSDEGYGFISSRDIPFTRIFFHWTSLRPDTRKFTNLRHGLNVEFTPIEVPEKGYRAIKIKVIE